MSPDTGPETAASDATTADAATRTVTLSVAVRSVPRPVAVSSYSSAAARPSAGAVKLGAAAFNADSASVGPATCRHAWTRLPPQGPPGAPPSVTRSPASASSPPAGPATATGRKLALPGLPSNVSVVSRVSGSKMRSGSVSRSLCSSRSVVSFVSRSNKPAGSVVMRSAAWVWLYATESSWSAASPSNTPGGNDRSACRSRSSAVTLASQAKSPALSAVIRPCADTCADTSSRPAIAVSMAGVTAPQARVASSSAVRTRARTAACTAAVRPQMPPETTGAPEPFTGRSDPPASPAWPSAAAPPSETPVMRPPFSARLSAATSTPSVSVSAATTV